MFNCYLLMIEGLRLFTTAFFSAIDYVLFVPFFLASIYIIRSTYNNNIDGTTITIWYSQLRVRRQNTEQLTIWYSKLSVCRQFMFWKNTATWIKWDLSFLIPQNFFLNVKTLSRWNMSIYIHIKEHLLGSWVDVLPTISAVYCRYKISYSSKQVRREKHEETLEKESNNAWNFGREVDGLLQCAPIRCGS